MGKLERVSGFSPERAASDALVSGDYLLAGLDAAACGLVAVDQDGNVAYANSQFLKLAGVSRDMTVLGRAFGEVFPGWQTPPHAMMGEHFPQSDAQGCAKHHLFWSANPNGGWIGVSQFATAKNSKEDTTPGRDALTGLYNREYISILNTQHGCHPADDASTMTVLYVDLDRFKIVNDTLGHPIGDLLLKKVAGRLTSAVRSTDDVVRMGGDEFAIFARFAKDRELEDIALRIIDLINRPFMLEGHQVTIGASIGLDHCRADDESVEDALRRADMALYHSKVSGRGRFYWFTDDMSVAFETRRALEQDLRKALLLDQFQLVYQPQVSLTRNTIEGFEALLRWHHPQRGVISPTDFIPIAEDTRLIDPIGKWVLEQACAAAVTWPDHISIAVNVSALQFEDDNFVATVASALENAGLPPERLDLELSESVIVSDTDLMTERMLELHALGVQLSLDDFGTGYSSFNYLRQLPFDKLKIDKSFVSEPDTDENAHKIASAVANLGTAMGLKVIAEGVETEEQMDRVREQGCSDAQGFLLSLPIESDRISEYLQNAASITDAKSPQD